MLLKKIVFGSKTIGDIIGCILKICYTLVGHGSNSILTTWEFETTQKFSILDNLE